MRYIIRIVPVVVLLLTYSAGVRGGVAVADWRCRPRLRDE